MFILRVISPDGVIVDKKQAESLVIQSKQGELTVLSGHANLVSLLGNGVMRIDHEAPYVVYGGVMEISGPDVTVLADGLKHSSKIDMISTKNKLDELEKRITEETLSDIDYKLVMQEREQLQIELSVARAGV